MNEHFGNKTFALIPSLNGKYEINPRGQVRNSKTKRLLKHDVDCCYFLWHNGKRVARSTTTLLWEVFGILPKKRAGSGIKMKVTVVQDRRVYSFNSFKECAEFFAPKLHYTKKTLEFVMSRRFKTFAGLNFVYTDELSPQLEKNRKRPTAAGKKSGRAEKKTCIKSRSDGKPMTDCNTLGLIQE